MRLGWTLVVLVGCDGVFNLDPVPVRDATDAVTADGRELDARPGCTLDTFSDGVTGVLARWARTMESTGVEVTVDTGQIKVSVEAGALGYAFVQRIARSDMTGASVTVELLANLGPSMSDTYFALTLDSRNFYYFNVNAGELSMQVKRDASDEQNSALPYNEQDFRWLRLHHDPADGQIQFLTSVNGSEGSWVQRHAVMTTVPITSLVPELGAGAYMVPSVNAREARFDNFELCPQ